MPPPTEISPLIDRLRELEQDHRSFAVQMVDPPGAREKMMERVGTIVEAIQAVEILNLMNQLRDGEANSVTLFNDNEEPPPEAAIEVEGAWTAYHVRRFEGDSILDCLKMAATQKSRHRDAVDQSDPGYSVHRSSCAYDHGGPCTCL